MNPFIDLNEPQLRSVLDEFAIPGISSVSFEACRVQTELSFWLGKATNEQAFSRDSVLPVASLSKMFTSIIVLRMVDAGKLTLHDTVGEHVPELMKTALQSATILHLLTHTAGLTRDVLDLPLWSDSGKSFPDHTVLIGALHDSLMYIGTLGQKFRYSNAGFAVLGLILERVVGKSYREIAQEYLITPLGLVVSTPDQQSLDPTHTDRLLNGYGLLHEERTRDCVFDSPINTRSFAPATGWLTSVSDMERFVGQVFDRQSSFLSEEMRFMLFDYFVPIDEARYYGLGFQKWVIEQNDDWEVYGHFGWWFGVISVLKLDSHGSGKFIVFNTIDDYSKRFLVPKSNAADEFKEMLEIPSEISLLPTYFDPKQIKKYRSIWGELYLTYLENNPYLMHSPSTPIDRAMRLVPSEKPFVWRIQNGHSLMYGEDPVYYQVEDGVVTAFIVAGEHYLLET
jgi:hypothetical protein